MSHFLGDWHALLVLVIAGFLPNEVWRMLGLWLGGFRTPGLGEGGGDRDPRRRHCANSGHAARRLGERAGLAALRFIVTRRSIFTGVVCGEAVMLAGKWWLG